MQNNGNGNGRGGMGRGMGRGMGKGMGRQRGAQGPVSRDAAEDLHARQAALGIDEQEMQRMHMAGMDEQKMQRHQHDQQVFHTLLEHHQELKREVENLPNGIRSVTTSENPELAALIIEHAHVMHKRLQEGFGLRFWDPAFPEIFARADAVHMEIRNLPNGVETLETSDDPNVVKLIQAHGAVVSGFVREGFAAAQRPSPLPADYQRAVT